MREIPDRDSYLNDYLLANAAESTEEIERIRLAAANLTQAGAAQGQVAVWDGAAFVPGVIIGDGNGISVVVVSPPFGLQVQQSQDLKATASPTFNGLTLTTLLVGSGGVSIKKIATGTVSIDPGSINAQTRGAATFTLTGAAVGDIVIMQPPGALNTGLAFSGCEVTGANTVTVYISNLTGSPIDDGANTWRWEWHDLT